MVLVARPDGSWPPWEFHSASHRGLWESPSWVGEAIVPTRTPQPPGCKIPSSKMVADLSQNGLSQNGYGYISFVWFDGTGLVPCGADGSSSPSVARWRRTTRQSLSTLRRHLDCPLRPPRNLEAGQVRPDSPRYIGDLMYSVHIIPFDNPRPAVLTPLAAA